MHLGKVNAATPTPLRADGSFDAASAKRLCQRWRAIGLDGVLLLGTMGEGLKLSDAVREAWVELALAEVGSKVTCFASAADVSRERMIARARRYAALGAPCVVLCLPPQVPAPQAIADVLAVADACPVPCGYYEIPANTGTALLLEEILQVLAHPNIVVCKDSSYNALLAQALTSPEYRPPRVKLLDGNEYRTVETALLGYDGVLHGGGVLTARWVRRIWELVADGRIAEAVALDRAKSLALGQLYNRFRPPLQNIAGQKYALQLLGVLDCPRTVDGQELSADDRKRVEGVVHTWQEWLA